MAAAQLDLLILKTLALAPLHGYGIGQRIEQLSEGVFRVTLGSLYPALQRLERAGLIDAEWRASESNRRARYYRLTRNGGGASAWRRRTGSGVGGGDPGPESDLTASQGAVGARRSGL